MTNEPPKRKVANQFSKDINVAPGVRSNLSIQPVHLSHSRGQNMKSSPDARPHTIQAKVRVANIPITERPSILRKAASVAGTSNRVAPSMLGDRIKIRTEMIRSSSPETMVDSRDSFVRQAKATDKKPRARILYSSDLSKIEPDHNNSDTVSPSDSYFDATPDRKISSDESWNPTGILLPSPSITGDFDAHESGTMGVLDGSLPSGVSPRSAARTSARLTRKTINHDGKSLLQAEHDEMTRIRLRPETVASTFTNDLESLQPSCLDESDSPAEQDDACAFDAKRDRKYEDLMISNRSLLSINRQHEAEIITKDRLIASLRRQMHMVERLAPEASLSRPDDGNAAGFVLRSKELDPVDLEEFTHITSHIDDSLERLNERLERMINKGQTALELIDTATDGAKGKVLGVLEVPEP